MPSPFRIVYAYRYRRTIGHGRMNCLRFVLSRRYLTDAGYLRAR
jgi:hypothetical protein